MSTVSNHEARAWEHASLAVTLTMNGDPDAAGVELREAVADRTLLASAQMLAALVVAMTEALARMPESKTTPEQIWQAAAADILGRVIDRG